MKYVAKVLTDHKSMLAEGPVWMPKEKALYFVDIEGKSINRYCCTKNKMNTFCLDDMPGCMVPTSDNGWIVAMGTQIIHTDNTFSNIKQIYKLNISDALRFNDGKCDAFGRLWAGTMAIDHSTPEAKNCGALYKIQSEQPPVNMVDNLTIPNGLAWNHDNSKIYHIDTTKKQIDCYDFDVQNGVISHSRPIIKTDPQDGGPDGMCIDQNGNLWVAMWGGYKVNCYNPKTGEIIHEVSVAARNVSCCTFGGDDMKTLFITTARDQNGNGGEIYYIKTNVCGVQPFLYKM